MKKANLIVFAVCAYWVTRILMAPAPGPELDVTEVAARAPASVGELHVMDTEHLRQSDWGKILEQHAQYQAE